jgi:hypothetical protein
MHANIRILEFLIFENTNFGPIFLEFRLVANYKGMPPSKKKSLRIKPSHLHNPHTDPKSVIEQLFLLRRFDEALELSYFILSDLCNREEEDNVHKNKQPAQVPDEAAAPQENILRLKHNCKVRV